jgi:DNA polymerase-3 subunit gamma/tau
VSTALYRRYRPESFADVIGQDHVTEPLMQALRTGRVNHAYLFSGPRGCGKTTSARILARCLNCEQGPAPIPCGVCESCVALARGGSGSVDVIEIDAASHGGVDDARDLRERASYGPAQSRYKIYIIDEAHMVTPQGFNALLKIVEEPPEHVKFIFATTEPEKVIGTIRSRTHHYPFRLVSPLRLQDYLGELCTSEKVTVAPGVLSFVVRAGGGSVRDSLSVLDQLIAGSGDEGLTYESAAALLGFTEGELLDATIDGLAAGDAGAVFRQIDKVIETGHDPRRFVEDLLERLRDLIVVAAVPDGASSVLRGVPEDQLERMRQQSAAFGPGALSRSADIVNAGLTEMTGATAPRLQLELICARVLLPGASGESGYAARLDRLERRLEIGGASAPAGSRSAPPASAPPTQHQAPEVTTPDVTPVPAPEAPPALAPTAPAKVVRVPSAPVREPKPALEPPLPEAPRVTPTPGRIDTGAIRRSWPDVLTKVATISRATWTFVSQNTRVLDYNGDRLLLGLTTDGLLSALRGRNHAEVVRQALIEVIGVDTRVEGVISADAVSPDAVSPDAVSPDAVSPDAVSPDAVSPDSGVIDTAVIDTAVIDSPTLAATAPLSAVSKDAEPDLSTPMQRARAAVAQEASIRQARSSTIADDSVVSPDDEDIEEAGVVGQPVIARVLGGTVIGELDQ